MRTNVFHLILFNALCLFVALGPPSWLEPLGLNDFHGHRGWFIVAAVVALVVYTVNRRVKYARKGTCLPSNRQRSATLFVPGKGGE